MNLLFLIFLHHLGDVAFQPSWLITNKKSRAFAIYEHAFVWAGVVSLGLYMIGEFEIWKFVFLIIAHWLIDFIKYQKVPHPENYNWIYPDQALHYLQVIIVYYL